MPNTPKVPPMPMAPPPMAPPPMAPPPMAPPAAAYRAAPAQQQLVAIYEGVDHPVTEEEFIIGRGQKTSDLCIRDSNVSRRHAVVVLHNGQYWMVDQQSTNGVEFMGAKIDRKRIDHGDVFKICDYEVTFVYR
jgi:pSer/pThr/pTyr-binding forkhead associated (FHA) protein